MNGNAFDQNFNCFEVGLTEFETLFSRSALESISHSVGPSVRRSVGPLVRRSVGPSVGRCSRSTQLMAIGLVSSNMVMCRIAYFFLF